MKLLNAVDSKAGAKGTPYTPKEVDAHEYSERIWATIAECKREAQELSRKTEEEAMQVKQYFKSNIEPLEVT